MPIFSVLTLCILMDFPIHIDTISMELCILYLKGSQVEALNYDEFLLPKKLFQLNKQCRPL